MPCKLPKKIVNAKLKAQKVPKSKRSTKDEKAINVYMKRIRGMK
jgi:hypothetical protein